MRFVRNAESAEQEIVGQFADVEEDAVEFLREDGTFSFAPADCVTVVGVDQLSPAEFEKWCAEQPQNFNRAHRI